MADAKEQNRRATIAWVVVIAAILVLQDLSDTSRGSWLKTFWASLTKFGDQHGTLLAVLAFWFLSLIFVIVNGLVHNIRRKHSKAKCKHGVKDGETLLLCSI
jgi:uncharacterized membrane protein